MNHLVLEVLCHPDIRLDRPLEIHGDNRLLGCDIVEALLLVAGELLQPLDLEAVPCELVRRRVKFRLVFL